MKKRRPRRFPWGPYYSRRYSVLGTRIRGRRLSDLANFYEHSDSFSLLSFFLSLFVSFSPLSFSGRLRKLLGGGNNDRDMQSRDLLRCHSLYCQFLRVCLTGIITIIPFFMGNYARVITCHYKSHLFLKWREAPFRRFYQGRMSVYFCILMKYSKFKA